MNQLKHLPRSFDTNEIWCLIELLERLIEALLAVIPDPPQEQDERDLDELEVYDDELEAYEYELKP